MWEAELKASPEFASALGDRRYNDQLTDLSPRAFNDQIARSRDFLVRLAAIDTTGLPQEDQQAAQFLTRQLVDQEQAARFKPWELPITSTHGIQTDLPAMAASLPFASAQDYDDYIARLKKIPATIRQASENLQSGIDDHRVQPAALIEKALAQTEAIANTSPAASPFAEPLQRFPASIDASTRKRISAELLAAIEDQVLPAYQRFARFLRAVELPAAATDPAAQPIAEPAQPLGYQAREKKILELRTRAQKALGAAFSLKVFRDQVTDSDALPLDALDQRINAWIRSQASEHPPTGTL
jgi:uncharacterized protein (DUF885 family)